MKRVALPIVGAWTLERDSGGDERGYFFRLWDAAEFKLNGLVSAVDYCAVSRNTTVGTLRGMHYQAQPHDESKLVSCRRGAAFDVIVDLRPHSKTYCQWASAEISAENDRSILVPPGCAHGYITLMDDTEIHYLIAGRYVPEAARGVRWNDPAFGIQWPSVPAVMVERDRTYPDFVV